MTRLTFLPWLRDGFAAAVTGAPTDGASRAALPVTVRLRDAPLGIEPKQAPLELVGPGDVTGLERQAIRLVEPYDGCPDHDPSYFPYIEFSDASLPWLFSPFGPEDGPLPDRENAAVEHRRRLVRPWLALVVVPEEAVIDEQQPGPAPLASLTVDAAQLPSCTEAWAWAHVQVTHTDADDVAAAASDPVRRVSRLVCPRRLTGGVAHVAALVPTFACGRATGLGIAVSGSPLAPAWAADGEVRLPVYHHWRFTTATSGSFEALARRLRPRAAPRAGRPIGLAAPGWGAEPGPTTVMSGVLEPFGSAEDTPDPAVAAGLARAVSTDGDGVQLRPPLYGQDHHGGLTRVPTSGWMAELNTDPRRRIAAGLGAWAVTVHQDELMDRAWAQLTDAQDDDADQARAAPGPATGGARIDPMLATVLDGVLAARHGIGESPTVVDLPLPPPAAFAPTFPEAAYTYLRAVAEEWLLPGIAELPDNSVVLMQTNNAFVESFLVGLNHAMRRELAWRRFPEPPAGATFFRSFWDQPGAPGAQLQPEIAAWDPTTALGTHTAGGGDRLVLLLRGALPRRFPTASVTLGRTDGQQLRPLFGGAIGNDAVLYGFDLPPQEAVTPADGGPPWLVILEEPMRRPRFGCDDPPSDGVTSDPLASWQDLDWSRLPDGAVHVPVEPLAGLSRPIAEGEAPAVWGRDAAALAAATRQRAFRVRIPVALWLTPDLSPLR